MNFTFVSYDDFKGQFQALLEHLQGASVSGCDVEITALDIISWEQRKLLNATLGDIAKQVRLNEAGSYVNITDAPFGRKLSKDSWRGVFMAVTFGQESVPNPEGEGFVVLSRSSKKLSKKAFKDLIHIIWGFGSDRRVAWSDPNYISMMQAAEAGRR